MNNIFFLIFLRKNYKMNPFSPYLFPWCWVDYWGFEVRVWQVFILLPLFLKWKRRGSYSWGPRAGGSSKNLDGQQQNSKQKVHLKGTRFCCWYSCQNMRGHLPLRPLPVPPARLCCMDVLAFCCGNSTYRPPSGIASRRFVCCYLEKSLAAELWSDFPIFEP